MPTARRAVAEGMDAERLGRRRGARGRVRLRRDADGGGDRRWDRGRGHARRRAEVGDAPEDGKRSGGRRGRARRCRAAGRWPRCRRGRARRCRRVLATRRRSASIASRWRAPPPSIDHRGLRREPRPEAIGGDRRSRRASASGRSVGDLGWIAVRRAAEGGSRDVRQGCRPRPAPRRRGRWCRRGEPRTWIEPRAVTSTIPLPKRAGGVGDRADGCGGKRPGRRQARQQSVAGFHGPGDGRAGVAAGTAAVMARLIPDRGGGCIGSSGRRVAGMATSPAQGSGIDCANWKTSVGVVAALDFTKTRQVRPVVGLSASPAGRGRCSST